jgi:uncharacterized protein (TIGR03437 family)
LDGTKVSVNGEYAPVVYASPSKVIFVCPAARAGAMSILVETEEGGSAAAAASSDSAPGIFTIDGSGRGQAAATIFDGVRLAMARNYLYPSEPAQPGDSLSVPVTGLSANAEPSRLSVTLGDLRLPVDEIRPVAGWAGINLITVTIPASTPVGDAVPLTVRESLVDGRVASSETATVAIEPVRP